MTARSPAFWVLVLLIVICFSLTAFGLRRVDRVAQEVKAANCNLKAGYVEQRDRTVRYLTTPRLLAAAQRLGFSKADLIQQRNSLNARIASLKDLEC